MKVLIGAAQVNGHRAVEVLDAVVHGWREGNPQAELDPVVASDGAADLLDAVQAHRGGRRGVITVLAGDGVTRVPVVTLRVAGTLYLQASDVLATTAVTPHQVADATSEGIGSLVRAAVAQGARRVVIGAGTTPSLDFGVGMLRGLAAGAEQAGGGGEDLPGLVARAVEALAGVEVVLASAEPTVALGLRGAGAALREQIGAGAAQALEQERAPVAQQLLGLATARSRTTAGGLLAGTPDGSGARRGGTPGAGCAGGLGVAVEALGGRILPGAEFVGSELSLAHRARSADLVVLAAHRLDAVEADTGVVGAFARAAAHWGLATVALTTSGEFDPRARATLGVAGAAQVGGSPAQFAESARRAAAAWRW
ncbi:glycerate kinase [Serinibacter salmoneus]|uniref:Glycerate kinase n=1 Tax=Serinibacter salmoneus TaxID=556530 RepID=A0A2A9D0X3_9MICO|nr:glycerate kinase [Serinibacter salmoneus]PFG19499.1 glycerate kinase [Serinibacter salmoneus]